MLPLLLALWFAPGYKMAQPGYVYQFPRDHFSHPDYKTEWWYYTGNLHTAAGHRFSFELVFFRQGQQRDSSNPSAWRIDDLYLAHLALTDIDSPSFHCFDRLNRAGPGLAGASLEQGRIWNGNWQAAWNLSNGQQTLTAIENGVRFNLRLTPATAPVIHGVNGVSLKSDAPGHASHYVSFPLLDASGSVNSESVTGAAWMDHEWFTNILEESAQGWDWFSVQLANHTELMLYELRNRDAARAPYASGTFIDEAGRATPLARNQISLTPLDWWRSPRTGARYPIKWKLEVPSRGVSLECSAAIPDQELDFSQGAGSVAPIYWEGAVRYSGSQTGAGYMELTGYASQVKMSQ